MNEESIFYYWHAFFTNAQLPLFKLFRRTSTDWSCSIRIGDRCPRIGSDGTNTDGRASVGIGRYRWSRRASRMVCELREGAVVIASAG